jgi:hypothetical protein
LFPRDRALQLENSLPGCAISGKRVKRSYVISSRTTRIREITGTDQLRTLLDASLDVGSEALLEIRIYSFGGQLPGTSAKDDLFSSLTALAPSQYCVVTSEGLDHDSFTTVSVLVFEMECQLHLKVLTKRLQRSKHSFSLLLGARPFYRLLLRLSKGTVFTFARRLGRVVVR